MDAFIIRAKAQASSLNAELDKVKFMSGQAKDVKEQADDLIMIDDNAPSSTTGVDGGHLGKSVMGGVTSPCPAKSAPAIEAKTPPTETKLKTPLLAKRSAPLAASSGSGEGDVKKKKIKPSRVGGKTLEQRRRELGDSVKSRIQVCVCFFYVSLCVSVCVCVLPHHGSVCLGICSFRVFFVQVEKWCVAAQTHCTVSIVSETFR